MNAAAYGKLPLSREYLRVNCHAGAARRFREWIDEGFDRCATKGEPAEGEWLLLGRFAEEDTAIVGLLRSSSDGLRKFPFACFTELPAKGLATVDLIPSAASIWPQLRQLTESLVQQPDTPGFKSTATAASIEVTAETSTDGLDGMKLADYAGRAFAQDSAAAGLADFLWTTRKDVMELPRTRRILRFPIIDGLDLATQATLWSRFLSENAKRQDNWSFLLQRGAGGRVSFTAGGLQPGDFRIVWPPRSDAAVSGDNGVSRGELGLVAFRREVEALVADESSVVGDLARFQVV